MRIWQRLIRVAAFSLPLIGLAGCGDQWELCNGESECCRVQTGPGDDEYTSACKSTADECNAFAASTQSKPGYGSVSYGITNATAPGVAGCRTTKVIKSLVPVKLPGSSGQPLRVKIGSAKDAEVPADGDAVEEAESALDCKSLCDAHGARCNVIQFIDSAGASKQVIEAGISEVRGVLIDEGLTKIPKDFLLRNFGLKEDPCSRGDTVIALSATERTLTNDSERAIACTISLEVPPGSPSGDIKVLVPARLEGTLLSSNAKATAQLTFSEINAPALEFAVSGFNKRHGGDILDMYSVSGHTYIATKGGGEGRRGCFDVRTPPDAIK